MGNSIVTKLSQPKGYQIGDEITVDGQKGYVAGVDDSGKPTSISHSADNLRVEREQYASWDRDEYAQNYLRNLGLDTAGMLRSMERTDTGLNYRHSFDSAIAMNLNPVYGQPEPMRNRGFMGRQLDSFSQWRDGVFNTYQDIAIQSGGGFMTGLVAAVETPTRLGLGVAEGALGLGGLLFDSSVRQDAANGMSYLFNNYDTVVPGAFNRWMDQSWDRQLSDLFVLGGEGLLGGVTGKYTWQAGKYGGSLIYNGVDRFGNGLSDAIFNTLSNSPTQRLLGNQLDSFSINTARLDQLNSNYMPDEWSLTSFAKGDRVLGATPNQGQSAYYTTFNNLEQFGGTAEKYWSSLQVRPHPQRGYRTEIGVYEFTQNVNRVPAGTVKANPQLGIGLGEQRFVSGYESKLQLVDIIKFGK